jgi:hypothetical protein
MPGRWGKRSMTGRRGLVTLGLALLIAFGSSALASAATESVIATKARTVSGGADSAATVAKKKKKKKKPSKGAATTQSAQVAFSAPQIVAVIASCSGGSHVTGGGYAVSPSFTPPSTGLRSVNSDNHPEGPKGWNAGAASFSTPSAFGTFTTFARCESDSLGKLASIVSSSVTLPPANAQTFTFNCPPETHVLSGGYFGAGLGGGFNYAPNNFRIIPLQSHRTGPGQWVVQVINSSSSPVAVPVTGYALCEADARGRVISEASTFAPLINDSRATGDPTCGGRTHVISGGFVIAPNSIGTIPATAIDEFQPVGEKTWHVGLHEFVGINLPPSSSLTSYAYCAPDSAGKKKKKKKKKKK